MVVTLAAAVSGCGGPQLTTDFHSSGEAVKRYQNILVMHLVDNSARRTTTETILKSTLEAEGVRASVSYHLILDLDDLADETKIRDLLADTGFDAVLTGYLALETEDPAAEAWRARTLAQAAGTGRDAYARVGRDAAVRASQKFPIQFALWDAATLAPVWTATTEPMSMRDGVAEQSKKLGEIVARELRARGLI